MSVGGLAIGSLLLIVASLLHAWWGLGTKLEYHDRPPIFQRADQAILSIVILLLCVGLAVVWWAMGIVGAVVAGLVYFFILPLFAVPLIGRHLF